MATARLRFRAGEAFGWIDYDDATQVIEVDHPSADVHAAVLAHFEARSVFRTPIAQPPDVRADGVVEDYYDDIAGTGFDSMDFFLRRATELAAGIILRWRDALVFWKASTVPEI